MGVGVGVLFETLCVGVTDGVTVGFGVRVTVGV